MPSVKSILERIKSELRLKNVFLLQSQWIRIVLVLGAVLILSAIFFFFHRSIEGGLIAALLVIPVIITGIFWGQRMGLLAGLAAVIFVTLSRYLAVPGMAPIRILIEAFVLFPVVGLIAGRQGDLYRHLRKSELKFRSFFEQSYDGMIITDSKGKIVEWNRSEEEITDFKKSDVLDSHIWDVICRLLPEKQKNQARCTKIKDDILRLFNMEEKTRLNNLMEQKVVHSDRILRFVQRMFFPITAGKGLAIGSICRDITTLKLTEDALRKSNGELRKSLARVKTLSGLLPICANCKKIRDDKGNWQQVEAYLWQHSGVKFSHSFCPDCARTLYPNLIDDE